MRSRTDASEVRNGRTSTILIDGAGRWTVTAGLAQATAAAAAAASATEAAAAVETFVTVVDAARAAVEPWFRVGRARAVERCQFRC
jgi:hypothetical protein